MSLVLILIFASVNILCSCSNDPAKKQGTNTALNVLCYSYLNHDLDKYNVRTFKIFKRKIEYNVTALEDYLEYEEKLINILLAKNDEVDIFAINNSSLLKKIVDGSYYVDLKRNADFSSLYEEMYPQIKELCTDNDKMFGYPVNADVGAKMFVFEDKLKSIGYSLEDIKTVDGFIKFCKDWEKKEGSYAFEGGMIYTSYYYNDYLIQAYDHETGSLILDTPEFRAILEECRNLYLNHVMFNTSVELKSEPWTQPVIASYGFGSIFPGKDNEYVLAPHPSLGAYSEGIPMSIYSVFYIVNPYSKHIDDAIKYLYGLADFNKLTDSTCHPLLYYNRDSYKGKIFAGYPSFYDDFTQDQLDNYSDILKNSKFKCRFEGLSELTELCRDYVTNGTITIDEVIAKGQDIIDMAQKEQFLDK